MPYDDSELCAKISGHIENISISLKGYQLNLWLSLLTVALYYFLDRGLGNNLKYTFFAAKKGEIQKYIFFSNVASQQEIWQWLRRTCRRRGQPQQLE